MFDTRHKIDLICQWENIKNLAKKIKANVSHDDRSFTLVFSGETKKFKDLDLLGVYLDGLLAGAKIK